MSGKKNPVIMVAIIFIFALGLRLLFAWTQVGHVSAQFLQDTAGAAYEPGYIAHSILMGKGFSSPKRGDTGPTAWVTPVLPYLIAADFKMFGIYSRNAYMANVLWNCIISAATVFPIFLIGKRIFGPNLGIGAALLWAIYPLEIRIASGVWDSVIMAFCVALLLLATLELQGSQQAWHWAGYGLLWALTVMFNPAPFSVLPFFLAWLAWRMHKEGHSWLRHPALAALVFVLVGCAPWTVRNYSVFHQFIPFRSNFGYELWLGNNDIAQRPWAGSPELDAMNNDSERDLYSQMGEAAFVRSRGQQAVQFIKTHPVDEVRMTLLRAICFWTGSWYMPFEHIWTWISKPALFGLVLDSLLPFLALGGVVVMWRRRNGYTFPVLSLLLAYPLIYYVTHGGIRYRNPLDPVLVILAAIAISGPIASILSLLGLHPGPRISTPES